MGSTTACGTVRQTLPVPEFPLDEAAVAAALYEMGLPWTIGDIETAPHTERQTAYMLYKDGEEIAGLTSAIGERYGERFVAVSFILFHNNEYSLPEEVWEDAIVLITLLHGGFENAHRIYNYFRNEFGVENTERWPLEVRGAPHHMFPFARDETAIWARMIDGVYNEIQVNRSARTQQEYLGAILLATDLGSFGVRYRLNPQ